MMAAAFTERRLDGVTPEFHNQERERARVYGTGNAGNLWQRWRWWPSQGKGLGADSTTGVRDTAALVLYLRLVKRILAQVAAVGGSGMPLNVATTMSMAVRGTERTTLANQRRLMKMVVLAQPALKLWGPVGCNRNPSIHRHITVVQQRRSRQSSLWASFPPSLEEGRWPGIAPRRR